MENTTFTIIEHKETGEKWLAKPYWLDPSSKWTLFADYEENKEPVFTEWGLGMNEYRSEVKIIGKFETDNLKFVGKWVEDKEYGVVIKLDNGDEYPMSCEGMIQTNPKNDEKLIKGWDGVTFKDVNSFPMKLGDRNTDIISDVQLCLGLPNDGRFTYELEDELEENNYGKILTHSVYKNIMKKCGAGHQESGYIENLR